MSARIIDGISVRNQILAEISRELSRHRRRAGDVPGLAILRVGDDPASVAYLRQKRQTAQLLGFTCQEYVFPAEAGEPELIGCIRRLNRHSAIHGILLQLPLPGHLRGESLIAAIDPDKDVDGLHPINAGRLFQGLPGPRPCTPLGVMRLLDSIGYDVAGKRAVVVGRSNIVGKPMALMLLAAHATATVCHRQSDLPAALQQADVVVAALGAPAAIQGDWIKSGAVVIDVGINRLDGRLVGDVDFTAAIRRASFITPVPGGVGAMTVAMLMRNTLEAWLRQGRGRTVRNDITDTRPALRKREPPPVCRSLGS
jgi:methylenetetrahydrofolate dehydrogenase (NADP+)/methenyltetrahydrofolate cyclohydrolase